MTDKSAPTLKPFESKVLPMTDKEILNTINKKKEDTQVTDSAKTTEPVTQDSEKPELQKNDTEKQPFDDILNDVDVIRSSELHSVLHSLAKIYALTATHEASPEDFAKQLSTIIVGDKKLRIQIHKELAKRALQMQTVANLIAKNIVDNEGHDIDKLINQKQSEELENLISDIKKNKK